MGRLEKVKETFLNPASTVTFGELKYLLGQLGYKEKRTGKTAGSRRAYIHESTLHIIRIHTPHPGNELKRYVKQYILGELKNQGLI